MALLALSTKMAGHKILTAKISYLTDMDLLLTHQFLSVYFNIQLN
jgi:hypothetical protein